MAPETTYCSSASKQRDSIGDLFCPNDQIFDTFSTRQMFTFHPNVIEQNLNMYIANKTFASSPPVAKTWLDLGPNAIQFTYLFQNIKDTIW